MKVYAVTDNDNDVVTVMSSRSQADIYADYLSAVNNDIYGVEDWSVDDDKIPDSAMAWWYTFGFDYPAVRLVCIAEEPCLTFEHNHIDSDGNVIIIMPDQRLYAAKEIAKEILLEHLHEAFGFSKIERY